MQRRRFRWLSLLVAFTILAASCGGEVTDDADGPDPETSDDTGENGGDNPTSDDETGGDESGDTGDDDESGDGSETGDTAAPPAGPNIHQDPRGGVFQEFQNTFDRGDHPFAQLDAFCTSHDAASDRVATDDGITADAINIGHIRSRLEDAEAFNMFVPVGDPQNMFDVFVDYINNECGGIRGRLLDLGSTEADILGDTETSRNAACLAMTADHHSVIVMNSTGFGGSANLCLVEEETTAFISTQGQNQEFVDAGGDLLISVSLGLERSMRILVDDLIATGALDGKVLGTAVQDTPGHAESLEIGLIQPLKDAGFDIEVAVVACNGSSICTGNVVEGVNQMAEAEIDVFFNVMGVFTAPGFIGEMTNQGFEPGDVQFYATDFQSQAAELVAAQIAGGNELAGLLYDGAIIVNHRATGENRSPDYEPSAFDVMCNQTYADNNTIGASHEWDKLGDSAYGMTASVCGIVRLAARAIYDAGDNPTVADIQNALINVGPWDGGAMLPFSLAPGKTESPDAVQTLDFSFPCDENLPFDTGTVSICITGRGDWRPVD